MSASAPPPVQAESNSARKKRERAQQQTAKAAPAPASPPNGADAEVSPVTNGEQSTESPYIRELQKQIRNINKKLNGTAKTDAIIAENPNVSLDELLASKKINADQKAQVLKKPALQAQLAQIEEQLAQYRKIDIEYQERSAADKKASEDKFASELAAAKAKAQQEAEAHTQQVVKQKLLLFSQFLRAAAAKRVIEEDADTEESKAFEGALLLVYGGDERAVQAAESIVDGSDDFVPSVEGQPLSITYSQLKALSREHDNFETEGQWAETVAHASGAAATEASHINVESVSDPTIAHAGLTELGAGQQAAPHQAAQDSTLPAPASAGEAGNVAAGQTWNNAGPTARSETEESYVIVRRDISETEAHNAPATGAQSWADDAAEAAANAAAQSATTAPVDKDDGFHEVQGKRGGHRGHRGDGEGRGRGRGRGGFRGDRGNGERGGRGGGMRGERRGGGGEHRGEHRGRGGRGGAPRGS